MGEGPNVVKIYRPWPIFRPLRVIGVVNPPVSHEALVVTDMKTENPWIAEPHLKISPACEENNGIFWRETVKIASKSWLPGVFEKNHT